jgi:hypothetical protein
LEEIEEKTPLQNRRNPGQLGHPGIGLLLFGDF